MHRYAGKKLLELLKLIALFVVTALAEIVGCYLPWLVLKQGRAAWLLLPAGLSLAAFAWLLTLHPTAAGRTYAAYGGVYIAVALLWLRCVDDVQLTRWDLAGAGLALAGMAVIAMQPSA
jgi:small multidrug resistance family-3 protein